MYQLHVTGGDFLKHSEREFEAKSSFSRMHSRLLMMSTIGMEANYGNTYATFFLPWVSKTELEM